MIYSMNCLLLVIVLVSHLFIQTYSEYINRGAGECASVQNPQDEEDKYEYTQILDWILMSGTPESGMSQADCEGFCNAENDPRCQGYAYYKHIFSSRFDTMRSHNRASFAGEVYCRLYGFDEQGDFTPSHTPTFTPTTMRMVSFVSDGSSNSSTFANASDAASEYTCYQRPAEGGAIGDPHITSIYGCQMDTPVFHDKDENVVVLMECENEKLTIHYKNSWMDHITQVDIYRGKVREKFTWKILKHGQNTKVCGNAINFHRYKLGINLRVGSVENYQFTGMLADKSCL